MVGIFRKKKNTPNIWKDCFHDLYNNALNYVMIYVRNHYSHMHVVESQCMVVKLM